MTEPIWFDKNLSLDSLQLQRLGEGTMGEFLGIEWCGLGADFLQARMPVDQRTKQPYGLLHGGASCVLAETIGSVASALVVDHDKFYCVGLEINANHLRPVREGWVTGTARPLHLGATTHVWDIRLYDDRGKMNCVSRLTVAVGKR
jgi:1,4-dihydroxy-2-naphthoyl-CoA hydrolase